MSPELFKKLIEREENHNFLHHIAEEELQSCKVTYLKVEGMKVIFIADCRDKVRTPGEQSDLSERLENRLKKHKLRGIPRFSVKVFHAPIPDSELITNQ